jgi:hypothetical protein
MSKPLWVCIICGEDFTRKSSGKDIETIEIFITKDLLSLGISSIS